MLLERKEREIVMRDGHEHMWWHAHRHPWGHGYEHMWAYGHGWGPGMPYMMLSNLFWMALFIALAVVLIHLLTTSNLLGVKQCPCIHPLLGFGKSGTGHNSKSTITGKTYFR